MRNCLRNICPLAAHLAEVFTRDDDVPLNRNVLHCCQDRFNLLMEDVFYNETAIERINKEIMKAILADLV